MEGWISLHRKFLKWEWFADADMVKLVVYMLLKANHQPGKWQGVDVGRGQLITGRHKLAEELNTTERKIRTCLDRLVKTGFLTIKPTNKHSVITICKYDEYQNTDKENDQPNANERPATDQQPTTNNNDNKKNKEYTRDFETKSDSDFLNFWNLYGKKADKAKCEQKWKRLKPEEKTAIFKTLPDYIKSTPDSTYRKNPLTYLNGKCWEDDIPTTSNETHRRASNIPYLN